MSSCCTHLDEEHRLLATCHEVIHYPSEDYPCLCAGFEGEGERCDGCQHKREAHRIDRVCRPASGDYCACIAQ